MAEQAAGLVTMGRVNGLFGVKGWVKVYSYTQPVEQIVEYDPWYLYVGGEWRPMKLETGRRHGKGVVVRLEACDDREQAAALIGADIAVRREQLPKLPPGEYYWADLVGLSVINLEGVELGKVDHLFETGANDVIVVRDDRERLIPFIQGDVVTEIDLEGGVLRVDWDPDF